MTKYIVLVAVLVLGLFFIVEAKTYKWVDNDGNVHFSDTPPKDYIYQTIEGDRDTSSSTKNAPINNKSKLRTQQFLLDQEQEMKEKEALVKKAEECEGLKNKLKIIRRKLQSAKKKKESNDIDKYRDELDGLKEELSSKCDSQQQ